MRFDQSQTLAAQVLLPAAAYDADNTPAEIALGTAQSATVLIEVGVGGITFSGTNKVEFKLTHSDTAGGSYAAVADADVVGATVGAGGIVLTLDAAHAAGTVTKLGYKGRKGFIKLLADFSGTHGTATPMAATVLTGNLNSIAPA